MQLAVVDHPQIQTHTKKIDKISIIMELLLVMLFRIVETIN